MDFVTVKESDDNTSYPAMTEKEIIERVDVTNKQIKQSKTVSHEDLEEESKNW